MAVERRYKIVREITKGEPFTRLTGEGDTQYWKYITVDMFYDNYCYIVKTKSQIIGDEIFEKDIIETPQVTNIEWTKNL